jgi:probable addiction module antidote protein
LHASLHGKVAGGAVGALDGAPTEGLTDGCSGKLRKWDSALNTSRPTRTWRSIPDACLQEAGDDAAFIVKALGNIARAKGMSQVSRDTGLSGEGLDKALSGDGNPSFATILKVTRALGIELHARPMAGGAGLT